MTNQEKYIIVHGYSDLIPVAWFSSSKYKNVEEVYEEALKQKTTWRELTGWNEDKKKSILL